LSTARAALQVTWLLAARPEGVRADEVADALHKSVSTAYNLLASLCDEEVAAHHPGGLYRLAPAFRDTIAGGVARVAELHDLSGLVDDLLARTHKRSYLAVVRGGALEIVAERGLQGMPKLPGLAPRTRDTAHALALGKVVLALGRPEVVERYVSDPGLRRFTPHTLTDPARLHAELEAVRRGGFAVEREELYPDFCCIAAPVHDARGRVLAVLGISMTRRAFDDEQDALARVLVEVAQTAARTPEMAPPDPPLPAPRGLFQPSAETQRVLDPAASARLASPHGTTRAVSAACAHNPPSVSALARSERRHRP
jgi:DNA-binding IclR family transcriptional regulator